MLFALIGWGKQPVGTRPRTHLAFLTETQVFVWDGSEFALAHERDPERVTVFHQWADCPSAEEVREVRQQLAPLLPTEGRV